MQQPELNVQRAGKPPNKESAVETGRVKGIKEEIELNKKSSYKCIQDALSGAPSPLPPLAHNTNAVLP